MDREASIHTHTDTSTPSFLPRGLLLFPLRSPSSQFLRHLLLLDAALVSYSRLLLAFPLCGWSVGRFGCREGGKIRFVSNDI